MTRSRLLWALPPLLALLLCPLVAQRRCRATTRAWALVAGGAIAWLAPHSWQRLGAAAYPVLVVAITLSTGNHFWLGAVVAAALTVVAFGVAWLALGAAPRRRARPAGAQPSAM